MTSLSTSKFHPSCEQEVFIRLTTKGRRLAEQLATQAPRMRERTMRNLLRRCAKRSKRADEK